MSTTGAGDAENTTSRHCGRCRRHVAVEPGTDPWELRDWWLCPVCATALTPGGPTAPPRRTD